MSVVPTMQASNKLDRLQRLHIPNDTRDSTQKSSLLTRTSTLRCWWFWEYAPITWPVLAEIVNAKLALIPLRSTADKRFSKANSGVGQQIPGRCIIGAIQYYIIGLQEGQGIRYIQHLDYRSDPHPGVNPVTIDAIRKVDE